MASGDSTGKANGSVYRPDMMLVHLLDAVEASPERVLAAAKTHVSAFTAPAADLDVILVAT
jgi:hypothetical protein